MGSVYQYSKTTFLNTLIYSFGSDSAVDVTTDSNNLWILVNPVSFSDYSYVYKYNFTSTTPIGSRINVGSIGNASSNLSSDGNYVWVSNADDGTISQINCSSSTVINTILISDGRTLPLSINSDGTNVWVLNNRGNTNSGFVTKINCNDTSLITPLCSEFIVELAAYGIYSDGTNVWATTGNYYIIQINCSTNVYSTFSPDPNASTKGIYSNGTYVWTGNYSGKSLYQIQISATENTICFKENTKILTDIGYKSIEDLRKGHLVKTFKHGYIPINFIGKKDFFHDNSCVRTENKLYECDKKAYPELFKNLIITGSHCLLIDNFISDEQRDKTIQLQGDLFITDFKYRLPACLDKKTTIFENSGIYTVYHIALEHDDKYMNYGIYANGLLVESCSEFSIKEYSNLTLID